MSDIRSPRRRGFGYWLCGTLAVLSVLYAVALIVIEKGVSEQHIIAFMLVHTPQPPLLAPLAAVALLCLLLRRWRMAAVTGATLVIAVAALMPPAMPRPTPRHAPGQRVRIVTWNVHGECESVPQIRETLEALQPDIVCLQEADESCLARAFDGASAQTHEVRTFTTGRIVRTDIFPLSEPRSIRYALATEIELPQGRVQVLNVHYLIAIKSHLRHARRNLPGPIELARYRQNETVRGWLQETEGPRVVCGDFNTPPGALLYRRMADLATDSFRQAGLGWGFTFPRRAPMIRIDYVWCAGGVVPVRSRAMDGEASDHRLVVTDVVLPEVE